jgi:hypothetical protein
VLRFFGPKVAHAGDEFNGPGLRRVFLIFHAGWSGPYSSVGPKSCKDFFLDFLFFLFLGKQNN